jgi:hypothetical protein
MWNACEDKLPINKNIEGWDLNFSFKIRI